MNFSKTLIAKELGVHRTTIHRWINAGRLESELAKRGYAVQEAVLKKLSCQTKTKTKADCPDPTPDDLCPTCQHMDH